MSLRTSLTGVDRSASLNRMYLPLAAKTPMRTA